MISARIGYIVFQCITGYIFIDVNYAKHKVCKLLLIGSVAVWFVS